MGRRGATQKIDGTADLLLVFIMGRDCFWDRKEQHREWNGMYIPCFAPPCPRGSLVPYKKLGADQLCSQFSVLILAVAEAVSSYTKVRSMIHDHRCLPVISPLLKKWHYLDPYMFMIGSNHYNWV